MRCELKPDLGVTLASGVKRQKESTGKEKHIVPSWKRLLGCTSVSGPQQNVPPSLCPLVPTQNGRSNALFSGASMRVH